MTSFSILAGAYESWAVGWRPTLGRVNASTGSVDLGHFPTVDLTAAQPATATKSVPWQSDVFFTFKRTEIMHAGCYTNLHLQKGPKKEPNILLGSPRSETATTNIQPFCDLQHPPPHRGCDFTSGSCYAPPALIFSSHVKELFLCL